MENLVTHKYIHFMKLEDKAKTSVWSCRNNKSGSELGQIKWYPSWRQYCFFPSPQTIFSSGCIQDIDKFISTIKEGTNE